MQISDLIVEVRGPNFERVGQITPENLVVSNGTQSFTLPDPIAEGNSITVEVASGRVYDQDGENQYSLLGPAPKLFQIPAGQSEIIVTADETTDATRVGFFYRPRFEVVH